MVERLEFGELIDQVVEVLLGECPQEAAAGVNQDLAHRVGDLGLASQLHTPEETSPTDIVGLPDSAEGPCRVIANTPVIPAEEPLQDLDRPVIDVAAEPRCERPRECESEDRQRRAVVEYPASDAESARRVILHQHRYRTTKLTRERFRSSCHKENDIGSGHGVSFDDGRNQLALEAHVVVTPHTRGNDQPARDVCLRTVIELCAAKGVARLVLDTRLPDRDRLDRQTIATALASTPGVELEYLHRGSRDEELLSWPDAIGWAWGAKGQWRTLVAPMIETVAHCPI